VNTTTSGTTEKYQVHHERDLTSGEKVKNRSDAKEITVLRFKLLKIRERYEPLKLLLNLAQRGRTARSLSALSWVMVSCCFPEDDTRPNILCPTAKISPEGYDSAGCLGLQGRYRDLSNFSSSRNNRGV